jgi:hypothetical protein
MELRRADCQNLHEMSQMPKAISQSIRNKLWRHSRPLRDRWESRWATSFGRGRAAWKSLQEGVSGKAEFAPGSAFTWAYVPVVDNKV